jgi:hypothetical protein
VIQNPTRLQSPTRKQGSPVYGCNRGILACFEDASGFEDTLAGTSLKTPLLARRALKTPLLARRALKTPLLARRALKTPLLARRAL